MEDRILAVSLAIATTVVTLGCPMPAGTIRETESHFVYPNSNVFALPTQVSAVERKMCGFLIFNWGADYGRLADVAIEEALAHAPSSSVLIDMRASATQLVAGLFAVCSVRVTGTPARVEIGVQDLSGPAGSAPPARTSAPVRVPADDPARYFEETQREPDPASYFDEGGAAGSDDPASYFDD